MPPDQQNHIKIKRSPVSKTPTSKSPKNALKAKFKPISKLVSELDKVFSLYVRQRDADSEGFAKCFTCSKTDYWKKMQCGHFYSRRHKAIRFDEDNTRPQCVSCNIFNQGRQFTFGQNLLKEIGQVRMDILERRKNNKFKLDRFVLEMLIKEYTEKLT